MPLGYGVMEISQHDELIGITLGKVYHFNVFIFFQWLSCRESGGSLVIRWVTEMSLVHRVCILHCDVGP